MSLNTESGISKIARVRYEGNARFVTMQNGSDMVLVEGSYEKGFRSTGEVIDIDNIEFLPPVDAGKFIGIGKNFPGGEDKETVYPNFFLKTANAITSHKSIVTLPFVFNATVIEGEFGVIISKTCRNVSREEVSSYILGFTTVCDLSGRDFIEPAENVPVAVKKSCDGFAPVGPWLTLSNEVIDFDIRTEIDGNEVQKGNSRDMIFTVADCISYISKLMTLESYDIISMGTPEPKPKANKGQTVKVTVGELGTLEFQIQ